MTRTLIGAVIAVMVPGFVGAQEAQPVRLADYVSFCLAVWEDASDLSAKASALGLTDATGSVGATITVGRTTFRVYKSVRPRETVTVTTTTFTDGKEWSCDVAMPRAVERADLEAIEKVVDLDGQIAPFGPTIMARWKMRESRPPVLIRAIATKTVTTLMVHKYEPTPDGANAKLKH
jgi:hypothetical protein